MASIEALRRAGDDETAADGDEVDEDDDDHGDNGEDDDDDDDDGTTTSGHSAESSEGSSSFFSQRRTDSRSTSDVSRRSGTDIFSEGYRSRRQWPRPPRCPNGTHARGSSTESSGQALVLSSASGASPMSPRVFVTEVVEVASTGNPWSTIRSNDTFAKCPARAEIFGLLGLFMTASGTCDSKWHEYTVQQWLKAGAFYLAMVGLTCPRSC